MWSSTINTEETSDVKPENPFTSGLLANDSLYEFISGYFDEGAELDINGTGVLIGEDTITCDAEDVYGSDGGGSQAAEKVMYTVTTRDGSIFYIIIDKSKVGENVYFLNAVDYTDLAALVDKEEENMTAAEKEIVSKANSSGNEKTPAVTTAATTAPEPEQETQTVVEQPIEDLSIGGNYYLYIGIAIVAVIVIGIAWYKKMGAGKKSDVGFDEQEEEEYVQEEPEQPADGGDNKTEPNTKQGEKAKTEDTSDMDNEV